MSSKVLYLNTVIPLGKHQGKEVKWVMQNDPEYIEGLKAKGGVIIEEIFEGNIEGFLKQSRRIFGSQDN